MLKFPEIQPHILKLGFLEIRWYGLLYIVSFFIGFFFVKKNFAYRGIKISKKDYEDLLFYIMMGVVLGGRMGYILFYNLGYYFSHPLHVFYVWQGGMSFHGGALGAIIIAYFFCRKKGFRFLQIADPVMPFIAIGLGLGRLGNFINAELWGRVTTLPWGMVFPNSDGLPRHPSQLYELFLEGIVLTIISQIMVMKKVKEGLVFWNFLGLYGIFRFIVEFFREPDEHLGFLFLGLTMGQILSSVMIISALIFIGIISGSGKDENLSGS
ncbi:MAG: prolipoprotein diacylglyceryl transferase [Candidatus Cloacimonadota bacterium]|nr:MAG: prolipoprotein diacylglyceryl transferase [Candidatus Cloacimonadota bacterium]